MVCTIDEEILEDILDSLAQGFTLKNACLGHRVPHSDVRITFTEDSKWSERFKKVSRYQYETWLEEALEGLRSCDPEYVSAIKTRIETIKWLMSKYCPEQYGDKITAEISGKGGLPLVAVINIGKRPEGYVNGGITEEQKRNLVTAASS